MSALVVFHTVLSLIAIACGMPAVFDLLQSRLVSASLTAFLVLAVATSASGFLLPFSGITPAVAIAIIALVILAVVLFARSNARRSRPWRLIYVGGVVASLYLLVFVGIVQAFSKIALLQMAAPTQSEPPFIAVQVIALLLFLGLGVVAARAAPETARANT